MHVTSTRCAIFIMMRGYRPCRSGLTVGQVSRTVRNRFFSSFGTAREVPSGHGADEGGRWAPVGESGAGPGSYCRGGARRGTSGGVTGGDDSGLDASCGENVRG